MSPFVKIIMLLWWIIVNMATSVQCYKKRRLPKNFSKIGQCYAISWHGYLSHWGQNYIPLKAAKNNVHTRGYTSLKHIGFLEHLGQRPDFSNLKGPTYSVLYIVLDLRGLWWTFWCPLIFSLEMARSKMKIFIKFLF